MGEGGVFTKSDLRAAFPSVEQIDRRMRDLRAEGWIIATYREDRSLDPDELRLRTIGGHVWERGYRSRQEGAISDIERRKVFAVDGYACRICGVAAGETYPDDLTKVARLAVQRIATPGSPDVRLRTLCDRCRAGERPSAGSGDEQTVLAEISELDADGLAQLRSWIAAGNRTVPPEQRIWARYLTLPAASRSEIAQELGLD
ncbi:hypothetical protein C6A87_004455 [Mycobacterium sp. ITM-2016-00317]|uniref:hypothetical protein n=1 Tax=Mycobacterium sp. ITM-2016-00317 TaxID=2099694 RepID=UPI00287F9399|nr:hypothetical protein [Mycobacterium sp. ITM-2016-00317]WNG88499.1 hypothetical protein C6A87_004455 [Mycobacterium sp. ITM-2016-00317]